MENSGNTNSSLNRAKTNIDDEFYTQLTDIEKELRYYKQHFKDKVVFCNCDDPFESNFFKYFVLNFNRLGLKKLIATCYVTSPIANKQLSLFDILGETEPTPPEGKPYKAIVTTVYDKTGDGGIDMFDVAELFKSKENELTELKEDGDFRSAECLELLDESDIVVTNPPFSLFIDYLKKLMEHQKKFLIIGSQPKLTNLDIFPLLQENKIWLGKNEPKQFYVPHFNGTKKNVTVDAEGRYIASFGNACWYTNLDLKKRHEDLILINKYSPEKYPKYDNYDAIECKNVKEIPCDYAGVIGVTPGFLLSHNPDQFEIVGVVSAPKNPGSLNLGKDYSKFIGYKQNGQKNGRTGSTFGRNAVLLGDDGKHDYYEKDGVRVHSASARIFIRNKHPEERSNPMMDINLHEITIRDLFDKYYEDDENGIVTGYHGQLNMRPVYQLVNIDFSIITNALQLTKFRTMLLTFNEYSIRYS
jgi:hypothetical protein